MISRLLLPKITCALVEVGTNDTVRFIHSSFKDYLEYGSRRPELLLKNSEAMHKNPAVRCITCLSHELPPHPLHDLAERSSVIDTRTVYTDEEIESAQNALLGLEYRRKQLNEDFAMTEYASTSWAEHLRQCLLDQQGNSSCISWRPFLSRFLLDRDRVSAWVEACYTFKFEANISSLVPFVISSSSNLSLDIAEDREYMWMKDCLWLLSAALKTFLTVMEVHCCRSLS